MDDDRQTQPYLPGCQPGTQSAPTAPRNPFPESIKKYLTGKSWDFGEDISFRYPKCCDSPACKGRKYNHDEVVCFLCGNKLRVVA